MLTRQIQAAERIRKALGLSKDSFSITLGFSATAYRMALRRKKISRWMMDAIDRQKPTTDGGREQHAP